MPAAPADFDLEQPPVPVATSWLCKPSENAAAVCLREVHGEDELGPVQVISGEEHVPAWSVPQLARDDDTLVAAWTAETDGMSAIRAVRIRLPAAAR